MKFNFTDKPSYLAWRAEWRTNYKELSAQIRQLKRCRKVFIRTYQRTQTERGPVRVLISKVRNQETGNVWNLGTLQGAATYQLELLKEAKALSWQMRQTRLAEEAA